MAFAYDDSEASSSMELREDSISTGESWSDSSLHDSDIDESSSQGSACSDGGRVFWAVPRLVLKRYEFLIPRDLTCRLFGTRRSTIKRLEKKSNCKIYLESFETHVPHDDSVLVCVIEEGDLGGSIIAMEEIRTLFPIADFPELSMAELKRPKTETPHHIKELLDSPFTDVIVSKIVNIGHFFVQTPDHPGYYALPHFEMNLTEYYNTDPAPPLTGGIICGVACCVPHKGRWYRGQVVKHLPKKKRVSVKLLDHGGFVEVEHSALRELHHNLITLPFQSAEVYMANFRQNEGGFTAESKRVFAEMVKDCRLKLKVIGTAIDGNSIVELYKFKGDKGVFLNFELCHLGFATWADASPLL